MNLQKNEELNTLFEKLSVAEPGEGVVLLRRIESIGKNIPKTAEKLIPFLHHPDYLVRSRVFIALGRIKDTGISNLLLDYLASEPGEEWQLRVLECLYLLNDNKVIPRISFLLDQHASPLLTRGAAWLIGYLGGEEALHILLKFAVSPRGRIVKSEIILEAIALALKSLDAGDEYWAKTVRKDPAVNRYFSYCRLPEVEQPRFGVYPYPDYLLDQAKAQGIKTKEFKRLYYLVKET
ncbi:MAG TPA: HEAT repeat domain-containing protein [Clostridia bacterium]|jgi:hypothetical protein|nr:HEAT repeat domain-containing protein [Clostridia bacterium]